MQKLASRKTVWTGMFVTCQTYKNLLIFLLGLMSYVFSFPTLKSYHCKALLSITQINLKKKLSYFRVAQVSWLSQLTLPANHKM